MELKEIQQAIRGHGFDGWLLYDFRGRDALANRILGLDSSLFTSRRWYYFIPAQGEPVKLVHQIEKGVLDDLPGKKLAYLPWKQMHEQIRVMLGEHRKIAMNYSPFNNIPYVSMVDAGTVELIRHLGYEVVSAADLIQQFEALIDADGYRSHAAAGERVLQIKDEAFARIGAAIREQRKVTEYQIQQFIMQRFEEEGLTCEGHGPIVGINDHPANPHFEPRPEGDYTFKAGDRVLIDLWAKQTHPGAIYYDVTWCGFVGDSPPADYVQLFNLVRDARKAAKQLVAERFRDGQACYGWEVDDAARNVIREGGYGDYFIHRTGHSIGTMVHGNAVNIDNLETRDERRLVPGVCFSLEPGIYIPGKVGVRSEINLFIREDGSVTVCGDEQENLILI